MRWASSFTPRRLNHLKWYRVYIQQEARWSPGSEWTFWRWVEAFFLPGIWTSDCSTCSLFTIPTTLSLVRNIIIITIISRSGKGGHGLDLSGSGYGQVADTCYWGNELSVSIKCEEILTSCGFLSFWGRTFLHRAIIIIIIIIICYHLYTGYLPLCTWSKPRFLGIYCCTYSSVTIYDTCKGIVGIYYYYYYYYYRLLSQAFSSWYFSWTSCDPHRSDFKFHTAELSVLRVMFEVNYYYYYYYYYY